MSELEFEPVILSHEFEGFLWVMLFFVIVALGIAVSPIVVGYVTYQIALRINASHPIIVGVITAITVGTIVSLGFDGRLSPFVGLLGLLSLMTISSFFVYNVSYSYPSYRKRLLFMAVLVLFGSVLFIGDSLFFIIFVILLTVISTILVVIMGIGRTYRVTRRSFKDIEINERSGLILLALPAIAVGILPITFAYLGDFHDELHRDASLPLFLIFLLFLLISAVGIAYLTKWINDAQ